MSTQELVGLVTCAASFLAVVGLLSWVIYDIVKG